MTRPTHGSGRVPSWVGGPLLGLASLLLTIAALEVGFRLADFDFEFKADAFRAVPIFYRQPIVPVGEAFFRRPGPDRWEGNALDVMYRTLGGDDRTYRDAPTATITYDALGFRNPETLRDWDVVVVGDSFTELGFLPYEDLFTTRVGQALGLAVKNLGVSYTGTFTQSFYLREYGKSARTTDAVLVFFEGNDFIDLAGERRRLDAVRTSGTPPKPGWDPTTLIAALPKQTSFVTAVQHWLTGRKPEIPGGAQPRLGPGSGAANAYFLTAGTRIPITLENQMPPPAAQLRPGDRALLADAIAAYAGTARELGLRAWLAFMPCKRRVLEGAIAWNAGEKIRPLPIGIPELVQQVATANGVRFVDLTPALRAESAAGRLTYNTVWDTHLNRLGSAKVAEALTAALARRSE